jgi:transposase InsO family protein
MGVMGLQAIYKGPNTSKKHPQHPIYPYLLRKLPITRPNQVWCSNITYIPVRRGFLYLLVIMDWATRKVLAWRLSNTLDASFCAKALNEAIAKYGPPETMNTPFRALLRFALSGGGSRIAVHWGGLDHHPDRCQDQDLHTSRCLRANTER